MENKHRLDETLISVSTYEVNLISNILQVALNHMKLDEQAQESVQDFITKLYNASSTIHRHYLSSIRQNHN